MTVARNHQTDEDDDERTPVVTTRPQNTIGSNKTGGDRTSISPTYSGKHSHPRIPGKINDDENEQERMFTQYQSQQVETQITEKITITQNTDQQRIESRPFELAQQQQDEYKYYYDQNQAGPNEEFKRDSNIDRESDGRAFDFENQPGTGTDNISRAEDSYVIEEEESSEYVPKTLEEVEDQIDGVIGDMLIQQ